MTSFHVIGAETLDLLVSAAHRFGQLMPLTTAAFCPPAGEGHPALTPTSAGQLLEQEQLNSLRRCFFDGRPLPQLMTNGAQYRYQPVYDVDPVQVLKACDDYEAAANGSPGWSGSQACQLIQSIRSAAIQHLPGYASAPAQSDGPAGQPIVIGLRKTWAPLDEPVQWLHAAAFAAGWTGADSVLITVEALSDVPAGLHSRPNVLVLTGEAITSAQWSRIGVLPIDTVVMCPAGLPWLQQHINTVAS